MRYKALLFLIPILLLVFISPVNQLSSAEQEVETNNQESNQNEKISSDFEIELASMSRVEARTRDSSVKIYAPSGGHGSGAYFMFEGHHVVFTVGHLVDEGDIYLVVDKWNNERFGEVVYRDAQQDFAIILIPAFQKTEPLRLRMPQYNIRNKVGSELVYSGFPAQHELLTIRGQIVGFENTKIIMHAAAWMGSSGSCVFDKHGNLVGILYALSVGSFRDQPVLIEDMIWVTSASEINWSAARIALRAIN